jgi:hypothetical protein
MANDQQRTTNDVHPSSLAVAPKNETKREANLKTSGPALHIAREYQSAPAEHWADKEVKLAAEEIRGGRFRPDLSDDADFLGMVGMVRGEAVKDPRHATVAEKLASIGEMNDAAALKQHPRVQEMLIRLEQEKSTAKTPQEQLEKAQMLHEANARAARKNCWDGQGRWIGKDNEEMRVVNILTWKEWLGRLEEEIGVGKIFVNRYAMGGLLAVLVPNTEYNRSLIITPSGLGVESQKNDEYLGVATIQPVSPEWMVMRFNEYGEPTSAKYKGWRTALLCLIAKKVITERQAHKVFPLGTGPAGDWYRQQLFELRARDGVVN